MLWYQVRHNALIEAIGFFGDRKSLCKAIHVTKDRLRKWLNIKDRDIPYEYCLWISYLTGISIERLSPQTPEINQIILFLQDKNKTLRFGDIHKIQIPDDFHDPIQSTQLLIIVDEKGVLISGLATLKAYQEQGISQIPMLVVDLERLLKILANPLHFKCLKAFSIVKLKGVFSRICGSMVAQPTRPFDDIALFSNI